MRGPSVFARRGALPSAKLNSTCHDLAFDASRHRKVGASMSGGKIDPSCG
jgi:hypothetical protein